MKNRNFLINIKAPQKEFNNNSSNNERKKITQKFNNLKKCLSQETKEMVSRPTHGVFSISYVINLGFSPIDIYENNKCAKEKSLSIIDEIYKFIDKLENRFEIDVVELDYGDDETRILNTKDRRVIFGKFFGTRLIYNSSRPHILPRKIGEHKRKIGV